LICKPFFHFFSFNLFLSLQAQTLYALIVNLGHFYVIAMHCVLYRFDDEMMMDEDNRDDSMMFDKEDGMNEEGDENSNDSMNTKEQKIVADYLNTQVLAEDNYNDPNRKYKCHRCKVAFTHQNYLTSHNKTLLHRKGEKLSYPMEKYLDPNRPYKCEVCKESFTQKNILLVHYNSVSHLHKLKRAMQEQQQLLGQIPASLTASLPPSATSLVTGTSSKPTSSSTPPNMSSSSYISSSEDDDKKPYKCNICKVAHSQASTMDIHLRSVLHQTRASKLQELAMTGQIDLTKPLIEQPETQKVQDQHKKIMQDMHSPKKGDVGLPVSFSTPIRSSSPMSNRSQTPNTSPPNMSVSPIASSSPQTFSCGRCNFVCGSQDQLLQHQHLYCMFQTSMSLFPALTSPNSSSTPNTSVLMDSHSAPNFEHPSPSTSPTPALEEAFQRFSMPNKKSSHMFKHLLESYGFEMVMQFNEYHQKRLKRVEEREEEEEPELDEQIAKDFPELAKATCQYCKKVFSSVWILKSHCEEIHQNVISMEILENFAEAFRGEYLKKVEAAEAAGEKDAEDSKETASNPKNTSSSNAEQGGGVVPTAPSTPTASTTPASSADSVSGNNSASAAGHGSSNIPMSLAQHMNDVQNAINAMAASQLQNFNPMLHPMMMASLGMGLPLGLNMNALAAMNLQPPLVPMMMPPQFDQMNQMNQNMQNQNSQYQQQRLDPNSLAKQQQQILQQQQASASQP
jgi:AT-binding transcription factor 1